MSVYMLKGLALAPGRLLLHLIVYIHCEDPPPSTDINSGKRDRTTMCECSLTVNISLAMHLSAALPASIDIVEKKGRAQTDLDRGGSFDTVHQGLLKITCQTEGFSVSENTVHLST